MKNQVCIQIEVAFFKQVIFVRLLAGFEYVIVMLQVIYGKLIYLLYNLNSSSQGGQYRHSAC